MNKILLFLCLESQLITIIPTKDPVQHYIILQTYQEGKSKLHYFDADFDLQACVSFARKLAKKVSIFHYFGAFSSTNDHLVCRKCINIYAENMQITGNNF